MGFFCLPVTTQAAAQADTGVKPGARWSRVSAARLTVTPARTHNRRAARAARLVGGDDEAVAWGRGSAAAVPKAVPAAVAGGLAGSRRRSLPHRNSRDESARRRSTAARRSSASTSPTPKKSRRSIRQHQPGELRALRQIDVPLDTEPAVTFRPYLPGKKPKPGATPGAAIKVTLQAPARGRHRSTTWRSCRSRRWRR